MAENTEGTGEELSPGSVDVWTKTVALQGVLDLPGGFAVPHKTGL